MNNSLNVYMEHDDDGIYGLLNNDEIIEANFDNSVVFNIIYNSIYKGNSVIKHYAINTFNS